MLAWLLFVGCLAATCDIGALDAGLSKLVTAEGALMDTLGRYLATRQEKTDILKSLLEELTREHSESVAAFRLPNPVETFSLVKRLYSRWRLADKQVVADAADAVARGDAELEDAARTLIRLQETYRLDTAALARGELNGVQVSDQLDSGECYDLGQRAFIDADYPTAASWMLEALDRHDEHSRHTVNDILGYIAYSRHKQGMARDALRLTLLILETEPGHDLATRNLPGYLELVAASVSKPQDQGQGQVPAWDLDKDLYKSLCRGEIKPDPVKSSRLRCRYADKGSYFLRLARLKEEEANLSPRILIYHGVASPAEIREITVNALPILRAAGVVIYDDKNKSGTMSYRTANNCWFKDGELSAGDALSRRAGDMAGIDYRTGEQLQIAQYGVGGHYEPHFDHVVDSFVEKTFGNLGTGNRIATVLYYMNDVEAGGATVFPRLKLTFWPQAGAAVVWFNLHADGAGDERTQHAGCPVLAGNKWVINKWLHERGQEFIRPCDLEQDSKDVTW